MVNDLYDVHFNDLKKSVYKTLVRVVFSFGEYEDNCRCISFALKVNKKINYSEDFPIKQQRRKHEIEIETKRQQTNKLKLEPYLIETNQTRFFSKSNRSHIFEMRNPQMYFNACQYYFDEDWWKT